MMLRPYSILTLVIFTFYAAFGQTLSWERVATTKNPTNIMNPQPIKETRFRLDFETFSRNIDLGSQRSKSISLPLPNGKQESFSIEEEEIMEAPLAKKYPNIRAYKGRSSDGQYLLRMDLGAYGLNAVIAGPEGFSFITPTYKDVLNEYSVYKAEDASMEGVSNSCGTESDIKELRVNRSQVAELRSATTVSKHKYRMAIACTGEWGAARGTVEKVLSDIVTSLNIINTIYEVDLGVTFVLIAKNDSLIHLDGSKDPYNSPTSGSGTLGESTAIMNNLVGVSSYDVGHVYTVNCTDVGGVAFLRAVCAGNKGGGVSCVGNNLVRNTFQIVSHEIGHQFGANHTFHSCGQNVAIGNDFEPGSGSTIMSYGGLCGSNNVVSSSDPYFHNASLIEIYENIRQPQKIAFTCAEKVATDNVAPTISTMPISGLSIPKNTPIMLIGKATDANNDPMTYTWEQKDAGLNSTPLGSPSGNAAMFRSFSPSTTGNVRVMPRANVILGNSKDKAEVIPFYSRSLNFSLTVRDNNKNASNAVWETMNFKVADNSDSFAIVEPKETFTAAVGEKVIVKWNLGNTNVAPVNCQRVDIYLATEKILDITHPSVKPLALGTPNDGKETITLPFAPTFEGRFIVKASDNIFFNINQVDFWIVEGNKPKAYFDLTLPQTKLCLPQVSKIDLKSSPIAAYNGKVKYEVLGLPSGSNVTIDKNNEIVGTLSSANINFSNDVISGSYQITIRAIGDNKDTLDRTILYDVKSTKFEKVNSISPVNGAKYLTGLQTFTWNKTNSADNYSLQISQDPSFDPSTLFFSEVTTDTTLTLNKTLPKSTVFYWRIGSKNECSSGVFEPLSVFSTEVQNCKNFVATDVPINITQSGRPTVESKVNIDANFKILDINISNLQLDHDNLQDLGVSLVSPKGTSTFVFNAQCPRKMTLNCSFDDEGPTFFNCTNGSGQQFKPTGSFKDFANEDAFGQWILKIEDKTAGNGGKLSNLALELCGNIPLTPVTLNTKNVLTPYKTTVVVKTENLSAKSDNTSPSDLTYRLLSNTSFGKLRVGTNDLKLGSSFTQADIDQLKVSYINEGPANLPSQGSALDSVAVIVISKTGSWEGVKYIKFSITNGVNNVPDLSSEVQIKIFPNPTSVILNIECEACSNRAGVFKVYNALGVLVATQTAELKQIDTRAFPNGMYTLQYQNGQQNHNTSFIVAK